MDVFQPNVTVRNKYVSVTAALSIGATENSSGRVTLFVLLNARQFHVVNLCFRGRSVRRPLQWRGPTRVFHRATSRSCSSPSSRFLPAAAVAAVAFVTRLASSPIYNHLLIIDSAAPHLPPAPRSSGTRRHFTRGAGAPGEVVGTGRSVQRGTAARWRRTASATDGRWASDDEQDDRRTVGGSGTRISAPVVARFSSSSGAWTNAPDRTDGRIAWWALNCDYVCAVVQPLTNTALVLSGCHHRLASVIQTSFAAVAVDVGG